MYTTDQILGSVRFLFFLNNLILSFSKDALNWKIMTIKILQSKVYILNIKNMKKITTIFKCKNIDLNKI